MKSMEIIAALKQLEGRKIILINETASADTLFIYFDGGIRLYLHVDNDSSLSFDLRINNSSCDMSKECTSPVK